MLSLAAIALTASINLEIDLGALVRAHRPQTPTVTCGIKTVGYRFEGRPGQEFRYAGDTYVVPEEGWIELIADRRSTTYRIHDRALPLDVWPLNQFGFREVPLPKTEKETNQ
ncbi:MAG TPA: hypothetical protein VHL59_14835 [Thermoanaerobaculia bacterium]|nr:hypothetical protein [Thermoanaerobaculia bacterium]